MTYRRAGSPVDLEVSLEADATVGELAESLVLLDPSGPGSPDLGLSLMVGSGSSQTALDPDGTRGRQSGALGVRRRRDAGRRRAQRTTGSRPRRPWSKSFMDRTLGRTSRCTGGRTTSDEVPKPTFGCAMTRSRSRTRRSMSPTALRSSTTTRRTASSSVASRCHGRQSRPMT